MGSNKEEILRLLRQRRGQETDQERILRLLAEKRAQRGGTATVVSSVPKVTAAQENDNRFLKAGAFSDGYQFGDVTKTILGTLHDVSENVTEAVFDATENLIDTTAYGVGAIGGLFDKDFQDKTGKFIAKEILQPKKMGEVVAKYATPTGWINSFVNGGETEENSVLGDKADGLVQSGTHLAGSYALQLVGVPAWLTRGVNAFGGEIESAFQQDATFAEAGISGGISAAAEIMFEKLSSGIKFKGAAADEGLQQLLRTGIKNKLGRTIVKYAVDAVGEGTEEVLTEAASAVGRKMTYLNDKEWNQVLSKENLFDAFIGGAVMSGVLGGGKIVNSAKTGRDFTSGLTANEEKVVNKLYEDELAKKNGKVTLGEKTKIYDNIVTDMENGRISTDTIESVLGGDTYKGYQDALAQENELKKEIEALESLPDNTITVKQRERLTEARKELEGLDVKTAKSNLFDQVDKLTANDTKLRESYNERLRSGQKFTADLTKYDAKLRPTIQRAIDNGEINNTRATHAFVEGLAKIEAEKGIGFDFTNNRKLAELGLTVAGRNVGGYVDGTNVTLNLSSSEALNKVVGHEVTHVFEGAEQYDALMTAMREFAAEKGIDWDARVQETIERYKNVKNADPEKELLADLVGEYLFTDSGFVERLSTKNPGLFKRIYEEIKYLAKTFAGTKQGAALEKVKKTFAEIYRDADVKNTAQTDGVKYSIVNLDTGKSYVQATRQVIHGDSVAEWRSQISKFFNRALKNGPIEIETIEGDVLTISKNTAEKARSKTATENGVSRELTDKEFLVKLHAEAHIDELAEISHKNNRPPVPDGKNHSFAKDGFTYRTVYFQDFDGSYYRITLSVGENSGISTVYNVGKIKADDIPDGKIISTIGSKADMSSTKLSISRTNENVNEKFSLSETTDTVPAGGYRITGEDIALAPTKEDIAAQEIATAQDAPDNAIEELGAPTREDIARMEADASAEDKSSHISLEDYANNESPVWRNVAYNDDATKTSIMQATHNAMVAEGSVVAVTQDVIDTVEQSFPDLRSMKKKERTPILKEAINKLKNNIRQFLTGLSNQSFEFEVNGKVLDAKLYSTGINEVLEKVTQEKANMLYSTEEIFRNARYLYSTPDYDGDPNVYRWNYFYTPVQIGDETVGVRIAVRDVIQGQNHLPESQVYNWNIKKDASLDGVQPVVSNSSHDVSSDASTGASLGGVGRGTNNRISHGASSDASTNNIPEDAADVKYSLSGDNVAELGAPTRVVGAYQGEILTSEDSTAVNTNPAIHTPEEQAIIEEYQAAVDEELVNYVEKVKANPGAKNGRYTLKNVSDRAAADIKNLTGVDVTGNKTQIEGRIVEHILKRHGENGKADHSMRDVNDIARIQYVLDNYDNAEYSGKSKGYVTVDENGKSRLADTVTFSKKVNGTYYVVEAVPDTKSKTVFVVSARMAKNGQKTTQQPLNPVVQKPPAKNVQDANENTAVVSGTTVPTNTVSQKFDDVKYSLSSDDVAELGAPIREKVLQAEKELHGPWRMTDPLDQKVEKLYRMMLREEVSEEDYIAQLVKADRQYQQRGSMVEEALERVREAYSKETTESPETEKKMERLTRKVLHKSIMENIKEGLAKAGFDLNTVLKNAKNLSTFATVDNTPQRVNEKTFGYKAGQIINDLTVNKAALNESDGIQWLNGQIDKIRKMSERYGIKPGSKESRAAQIYGEGFWVNEVGEYIQYGDAELAADFPDTEKQAKIKALAKSQEVRQMYDDTLDAINAARVRNGYPAIPRRENYFLHFRAQDDTFSRIGVPFNPNDVRAKDLPTDLNGVTADLKPGKPFFASEMHRTGDKTTYDLLGGLERYMNSAKNQIYHIDDIQIFRAMRNYIADMFGQANGLADLDSLSPEEQEQRIKEVFDNHLSTYAKFLNEEANIFAGKTALIDRGVEGVLGRRAIQFLHTLNGQVGKNMVGYNISSAGTNVLPVVQATAMLPKADMVKAFAQTISNKFRSDGFVESDPALIRRRGADQFAKTPWQRISDPGYALMSAVDNLSSELIVRAKYNELTRKGMDSQQAHIRAGEWASRLMGDRSLGQMPQLYNSKTLGLITKFQLEVRNQLDAMGYDVIQEAKAEDGASKAKKAAKVASTMAQLAIFQHLFGQAYESIAGYNPAFDIVENIIKLFGFDDEEESEDTVGDNVEQAFLGLLEDLPYTSTFTGGRIPIASALPVKEVITGKDSYGNEKNRLETLAEALPYYILPGGYGQAKKTYQGIKMFDDDLPVAGSYTDSGNLRFPVEEDSIADWLQAALFGQYASKNAREYFDNGWAPLKEKQIEEYAALDIPIADYREIRKQLGKLKTVGEKVDYIGSLDLTVEQKNILVNNVLDRKESVDMTDYQMYEDFDEFDFYIKNQEKYQFLKDNGIAYKTYNASKESREAYSWAFKNPEKFQVSKAVSEDIVVYKGYTKDLEAIKADKDSSGNSVSGSRKKKVVQYINGLDAEYGAKLVLYKMEYPSDDSYNGKIIEYVNGIEGFTYEQKATVLTELGFKVDAQGRISW